jgi:hypothetical protein
LVVTWVGVLELMTDTAHRMQAATKIAKASDVGLQAYKPGTQLAPEERVGINKCSLDQHHLNSLSIRSYGIVRECIGVSKDAAASSKPGLSICS